jgi:hypothetical protein
MTKLASNKAVKFVKTLKELNTMFIAHEQRVFSMDEPNGLSLCYGADKASLNKRLLVQRLASVCATMKEAPVVRCNE